MKGFLELLMIGCRVLYDGNSTASEFFFTVYFFIQLFEALIIYSMNFVDFLKISLFFVVFITFK